MYKHHLNISEATLWDNLKRKVDRILKKIDEEKDGTKRLEHFNAKKTILIEQLLEDIGKEFFKIFFHRAIIENIENRKWWSSKYSIVKKVAENFKFYFWPGYTTLNGRRIFITGTRKGDKIIDEFFTGIGNKNFNFNDRNGLKSYLSNLDSNPELSFNFSDKFWIKDIPSTAAFDKVLNQYYIDKNKYPFQAPSTHFWKSYQRDRNNNLIPMRLKSDGSEFRILEVSVGQRPSCKIFSNKISIVLGEEELAKSGQILNGYFDTDNDIIDWVSPDHKKSYLPWPFYKLPGIKHEVSNEMRELQLFAYSYWISETLSNSVKPLVDYSKIRDKFMEFGIPQIAQGIVSFDSFLTEFTGKKNRFQNYYYNNWYTLYLDSYSENVDLGTAMFLTSEKYDSDFLMKCANWIRWIFNELRILEATAKEEVLSEDLILNILKHSQKHYLQAIEMALSEFQDNDGSLTKIPRFCTRILKGHYEILDLLAKGGLGDSKSILKFPVKFSIGSIINSHIEILAYIIKKESFYTVLKNIHPDDKLKFQNTAVDLLNENKVLQEENICSYYNILSIILKELIINALENIDINNPYFSIDIHHVKETVIVEISNSVSDFTLEKLKKNYDSFQGQKRFLKRFGWHVISRLTEIAGYNKEVSSLDELLNSKIFRVTLFIPDEQ